MSAPADATVRPPLPAGPAAPAAARVPLLARDPRGAAAQEPVVIGSTTDRHTRDPDGFPDPHRFAVQRATVLVPRRSGLTLAHARA